MGDSQPSSQSTLQMQHYATYSAPYSLPVDSGSLSRMKGWTDAIGEDYRRFKGETKENHQLYQ